MSGTNQYLQWDTAGGASVYDPATYAALAVRLAGCVPGVADPIAANTAWRQSSVATAAIAQFVCDYALVNMNDDGSVANFETNFVLGLNAMVAAFLAAGSKPIKSAKNTVAISSSTINIDFSLGNYFLVLMNANITTITFSNFPASGLEQEVTVDFVGDGTDHGHTFLTNAILKWLGQGASGTAPTFVYTAGYENTVVFKVRDGVTTRVSAAYSGTAAA